MMTQHTLVTSFRMIRGWAHRTAEMIYIGMPGPAARAAGIADDQVGPFGKPWSCLRDTRGWEIAYREYLYQRMQADADFALAVRDLHGKTLVCWCKGKRPEHEGQDRCHGDILAAAVEWIFHGIEAHEAAGDLPPIASCDYCDHVGWPCPHHASPYDMDFGYAYNERLAHQASHEDEFAYNKVLD